ncbi:MAG: exodeoxyribonuclease VII large subunit [Bdellovibrionales bacterium]|nr:exodeoxyribonuclease VII large subunit [Bdellovibrionales bacterium]
MDLFEYSSAQEKESKDKQDKIFSVSELTLEIKNAILASEAGGKKIWIRGEISNYRGKNQSGHIYFRLKDQSAVISCVFFRFANAKSTVEMKEGQEIIAGGKIDLWEKGGNYQLIVDEIKLSGEGQWHQKFEETKKKLQAEGLFDEEKKRALPQWPTSIAVVTSATGSVIKDILHVISHRFPHVKVVLFPVKVQGEGAAQDIVEALSLIKKHKQKFDVCIVGRGGGSIEDLWPFNEEIVARAIYDVDLPVVSAVGHQTDYTICDFVADIRAATPSHAAEMIVPDQKELLLQSKSMMENIIRELSHRKHSYRQRYQSVSRNPVLRDASYLLASHIQDVDLAKERLTQLIVAKSKQYDATFSRSLDRLLSRGKSLIENQKARFRKIQSNLELLDPMSILSRGYSVVRDKNNRIVTSHRQVSEKQDLEIVLSEGKIQCEIKKTSSV